MRNIFLTVIFFIIVLSIPYIVDGGVVIEPRYQQNQLDWVDPNSQQDIFQEYYISEQGLKCQNQIFQIYHLGTHLPARKCQLPDGAWFIEQI